MAEATQFREHLLAAASAAYQAGEIDRSELRLVRMATRFPRLTQRIQERAESFAANEGFSEAGWTPQEWIDFLRSLMPIIIEFIKMIMGFFT